MPLDFPNSPTVNQVFNAAGVSWMWDGVKWTSVLSSGGPFLPLSGGTVTGNVSIGADKPNYVTIAGGVTGSPAMITTTGPQPDLTIQPDLQGGLHFNLWRNYPVAPGKNEICRYDYSVIGTNTGQTYTAELHSVNTDTLAGGMAYYNFFGGPGTGASGGRNSIGVHFSQSGVTSLSPGEFYVGISCWAEASHSAGGSGGGTRGSLFAANDLALLNTGATYFEELCGYELDVGVQTGAGCSYKHGIKVNLWSTDAVAGAGGKDTAYSTSSNATTGATVGWDVCYAIGDSYGQWPVKTTGALIGTVATGSGTSPPYACAWGIDFGAVAFSGGLIRGPGFSVNGSGGASFSGTPGTFNDLSKHISLKAGVAGLNADSGGAINYVSSSAHDFWIGGALAGQLSASGINSAPIGQSTPAAGSFTTLSASGAVSGAGFTTLLSPYALTSSMPTASSTTPVMDGTATIGVGTTWARADHRHPTDTSLLPLAGGTMSNAIHFSGTASGTTDLAKHIDLNAGTAGFNFQGSNLNYVLPNTGSHAFYLSGVLYAYINTNGFNIGTGGLLFSAGPSIRSGTGAATGTQPKGSLWLRTDGAVGSTLYVTQGGGTWAAVAGV